MKYIKTRSKLKREIMLAAAALIMGLLLTATITKAYSDTASDSLSRKFIRLHVLANSDSEEDQRLKLKVRDGILELLSDDISKCGSTDDAKALLAARHDDIKSAAESIMKKEGSAYTANVSLERGVFPTKNYGDFVLVAGAYDALRVEIGKAAGNNWWCVVYPPLCYVDVATNKASKISERAKTRLKNDLSADEYKLVADNDALSVKVKFKTIEMWQERKLAKNTRKALASKNP